MAAFAAPKFLFRSDSSAITPRDNHSSILNPARDKSGNGNQDVTGTPMQADLPAGVHLGLLGMPNML